MENPTVPLAGKRHGSEKASAACRGNIYSRHAVLPERTDDRGRPSGHDPLLLRGLEPIPPESGRTCPKGDCRGHKRHTTGGEIFRWNRAMGTAIRLRENGLTFPIGKHGANDRRGISGRDAARESRSRKRPQADGMDMKLPNKTPRGDYLPGASFIP